MRYPVLAVLFCIPLLPARGGAGVGPNALTPREVADGWVLLFDGETTFGWREAEGGRWAVTEGALARQPGGAGPLVTTTAFGAYLLKLQYRAVAQGQPRLLVGCDADGRPTAGGHAVDLPGAAGGWVEVTVEVRPDRVLVTRGRSEPPAGTPATETILKRPSPGHIALAGQGVTVRGIKLRPLGLGPLFNGKDLTGWREFPGKKSKFTVTEKGELNVKDGPGDLQTEGKYGDFVLQFECVSHGKHLNSGIFFRCRPNEYQNGYEAQVRNQFTPGPTQEYVVEDHDPATHKLLGKRKVKSPAVDYGTGAIYRRMPARRQASKDGEWFTLTVVARGNHFATWVNGLQVVDWTDHRPRSDNARTGCRLQPGHISIQGHDPTTDLSFRNLRVAELPPDKSPRPKGEQREP